MSNQAFVIKPKAPPVKITFVPECPPEWAEDTWGIRIYRNGKPGPWVHWCDRPAKRVCVSEGIRDDQGNVTPVGWAGSKSQAEAGAEQLQHLYDIGEIK